nr:methyltransferase domain-containing protein [Nitrosopumilus sp.]
DDFNTNKKYEIIWMSHVFEHLVEPNIFLEKIKKNMNEDSILFIEVPNCEHPSTLNDSIFLSPHVYHFTSKSIIDLCKKHNFEIITCKIFRPATKIEGIFNKFFRKFYQIFPYYPRIECDVKHGRDLRILLKKKR